MTSSRTVPGTKSLTCATQGIITLGEALDVITLLPSASKSHRGASTTIRLTLARDDDAWLLQAGLPGALLDLPITRFDREFVIRVRAAVARSFPHHAEANLRGAFTRFFKLALARGWTASNPMLNQPTVVGRSSRRVVARARQQKRLEMPAPSQIALLLSDGDDWVARGDWLTLDASARPQEVRAIRWTDIKLHPRRRGKETGGQLTILFSMGSGAKALVPGPTKTVESRRVVQFGPELAAILRAAMPPKSMRHQFIVSLDGKPVTSQALKLRRQERQIRLGIARATGNRRGKPVVDGFFDGRKLRHAFAARRIEQGMPHTTLARQMGHKHHRITLNLYGYLLAKVVVARQAPEKKSHDVQAA